jgi:hypothetical protein
MIPVLSSELWEVVLSFGGPLELCRSVDADKELAAAMRLQRVFRTYRVLQRTLSSGLVRVQMFGNGRNGPWREGEVIRVGDLRAIALLGRRASYLFLPCSQLRIRRLSHAQFTRNVQTVQEQGDARQ